MSLNNRTLSLLMMFALLFIMSEARSQGLDPEDASEIIVEPADKITHPVTVETPGEDGEIDKGSDDAAPI